MESQDGIQRLLAAEQEAQAIVNAARQEKTARLRQAKEEADAEVGAYRAQREAVYQEKLSKQSGDKSAIGAQLAQDAESQVKTIREQCKANEGKVTAMLKAKVTEV